MTKEFTSQIYQEIIGAEVYPGVCVGDFILNGIDGEDMRAMGFSNPDNMDRMDATYKIVEIMWRASNGI